MVKKEQVKKIFFTIGVENGGHSYLTRHRLLVSSLEIHVLAKALFNSELPFLDPDFVCSLMPLYHMKTIKGYFHPPYKGRVTEDPL